MPGWLWISLGLGFIFVMTTAGSAMVFFLKQKEDGSTQKIFLGFAAGVMIAASIWSLLNPAIEEAEAAGQIPWVPAAGGIILGLAFLMLLDNIIPHLHAQENLLEGPKTTAKRTTLLISAVTLHNIPEGMAVGLSFALAVKYNQPALYQSALALAIGIGIQNFPEGAAVSLPLKQEGKSSFQSFLLGSLSGIVEPVFGALAILLAGPIGPLMPWLLSFAAGAMLYVVIEELIPEANLSQHSHSGTLSVMVGFLVMMILDIALG